MQMIVVLTKMMDYTTLMELIAYGVSVSGSLNIIASVYPVLLHVYFAVTRSACYKCKS